MYMNTNIRYNRAGCTALMRGKIHSQSTLNSLRPAFYLNSGVLQLKKQGTCSRDPHVVFDDYGVLQLKKQGTCSRRS